MAQPIDWSGIKAAAIALKSVQEAARRAGADLPANEQQRFIERVNKRAYRERWLDQAAALALSAPTNAKPLSKPVQSGADTMQNKLAEDSAATRAALATAARKAGEAFARKSGEEVIEQAKPFQQITSAAGMIGGWGERGQDQGADMILLSIGGNVNLGGQHIHQHDPPG